MNTLKYDNIILPPIIMIIVESHQIPKGKVSPEIFELPCVYAAFKNDNKGVEYLLTNNMLKDYTSKNQAYPSDWICKDEFGVWHIINNGVYKNHMKRQNH